MSVAENIAYGLPNEDVSMEEIIEAAKAANAHDFVSSLPQVRLTTPTSKVYHMISKLCNFLNIYTDVKLLEVIASHVYPKQCRNQSS